MPTKAVCGPCTMVGGEFETISVNKKRKFKTWDTYVILYSRGVVRFGKGSSLTHSTVTFITDRSLETICTLA